jgi:hypothetical protein
MQTTLNRLKRTIKYVIMFIVTALATKVIPTCGVLQKHAVYVGLISASTFALIDMCDPHIVIGSGTSSASCSGHDSL